MRIGVCSLAIGDAFKEAVKYGVRSKVLYCQKHGYDFIQDDSLTDHSRHLAWSKIPVILNYLTKYDYLVWVDADTLIMNPDKRLEDYIAMMADRELMYVASLGWVNTGVMFIKNTPFMLEFFAETWGYTNEICWEQGAIDRLYRDDWRGCRSKIVILPDQTVFNSLWHQYRWGQFLVHFPGCGEPNRPENCLRRMMDMFCVLRMDEESEEEYGKRLQKLRSINMTAEYLRCSGEGKYLPLD